MVSYSYSFDRFIPQRKSVVKISSTYSENDQCEEEYIPSYNEVTFFNIAKERYNKIAYRKLLAEVLFPGIPKSIGNHYVTEDTPWPVKLRKKPSIGPPYLMLDVPNLDLNVCHNVVDWGKKDYIATVHQGEVHFWHPLQQLSSSVTNTCENVGNCIKFNNAGDKIGIALANPTSKCLVWDCEKGKVVNTYLCGSCAWNTPCSITTMVWSADERLLVGCSNGAIHIDTLMVYSVVSDLTETSRIFCMEFSSNGQYLAISLLNLTVIIISWPSMKKILRFHHKTTAQLFWSISWHPWKESLLVAAARDRICLINVLTKKIIGPIEDFHGARDYFIDCISFNPFSAELVVSYFAKDISKREHSVHLISVLKDLNTVVDEVRFHLGRVPYLLWNSTGTKLGTVGSDDNLCLWDFFGSEKGKKNSGKPVGNMSIPLVQIK